MPGLYTVCAKRARQKEHVHTDVGRDFGHVTTRLGHQRPLAGGAKVVSAGAFRWSVRGWRSTHRPVDVNIRIGLRCLLPMHLSHNADVRANFFFTLFFPLRRVIHLFLK